MVSDPTQCFASRDIPGTTPDPPSFLTSTQQSLPLPMTIKGLRGTSQAFASGSGSGMSVLGARVRVFALWVVRLRAAEGDGGRW